MNKLDLDQNEIITGFNKIAKNYDEVNFLSQEIGSRLLERLDLIKIQPKRILDLGCGTCQLSKDIKDRFPNAEIYSLDISIEMLKIANSKVKPNQLICSNATQLPFESNSFDLILSNLMFHWTDALNDLVKECFRVLNKQSLLFFATLGPYTLYELKECFKKVDDYQHVHSFMDLSNIGDLLFATKFLDPVVDKEEIVIQYNNVKQLFVDLKAIGVSGFLNSRKKGLMTPSQLKKIETAYDSFRNSANKLPVTCEVIYGHAWVN